MSIPAPHEFTEILRQVNLGDQSALAKLIDLVYHELHDMASRRLRRERNGHTLNTTGLVHEAYFKLVNQSAAGWQDRAHFFRATAQTMRRILIDHARRRDTFKRGEGAWELPLEAEALTLAVEDFSAEVIALDEALTRLSVLDPQQVAIIEQHIYNGLSIRETAEILNISPATVKRDWASARAWLYREIFQEGEREHDA